MKGLKLKKCPFCGNPNVQIVCYEPVEAEMFRNKYAVLCDYRDGGCGAESGHYSSTLEAQVAWNSRKRKWEA